MTDTKLLPLPAWLLANYRSMGQGDHEAECKHYARANVAHATSAKDAEIERLRSEVERLAEALRLIESAKDRGFGIDYARGVAQSALRDHDQEVGNG